MYQVSVNDKEEYSIELEGGAPSVNGHAVAWDLQQLPDGSYSVFFNGKSHVVFVEQFDPLAKTIRLTVNGHQYAANIKEPLDQLLAQMGLNLNHQKKAEAIKAPMPGLVLKVLVQEGAAIKKGDPVLVLEAMKMENVFKATADAVVKAVTVAEGSAVEKGAVLIELE